MYLLILLCGTLGEGRRHGPEGGVLEAREEQLARVEDLVVILRRPVSCIKFGILIRVTLSKWMLY